MPWKIGVTRLAMFCVICSSSIPTTSRPSRCSSNWNLEPSEDVDTIGFGSWRRQQVHEHFVEILGVQVGLHLDGRSHDFRLVLFAPTQSAAITCAAVEVDI